ncbi:MAG: Ni/Fe-hydrogenase, b-type cytochrome subunit [Saprospiraceae bacterium]|nr:Ni/Fe-hydrogenase, b-type cytochrome subunit [Saprospiraceae bacterium]
MKTVRLRRVYVWQMPVRIFHWINALCILVLGVTGYLISNPPVFLSNAEASNSFWFGTNRFIHFTTAYIFLSMLIMRLYWAFVGNKYASWRNFIPINKKFIQKIGGVLKHDILLLKTEEDVSIGHNALAGFSYFMFFLLTLIMIVTGFGLYADSSTWFLPKLFAWVPALFGGDYLVREIHHVTMWILVVFILIHLYLVFLHDQYEGRGETSAMISGYKFIEEEVIEKQKEERQIERIA